MAKPSIALLIGVGKKPDGKDPMGKDPMGKEPKDDPSLMGLEAAMEDFIAAVKSGDSEAAAQAFKDACEMCNSSYEEKEGETEDEQK